jgi:hypothetical protein
MEAGPQADDEIAVRLQAAVFLEDPLQKFLVFFIAYQSASLVQGHPVADAAGKRKVVPDGNQANGIVLRLLLTDEGAEKAQFLDVPGKKVHDPQEDDRFAGMRFRPENVNAFRPGHFLLL